MKTKMNLLAAAAIIFGGLILLSFTAPQDPKPWDIPSKYLKMENPLTAGDADMMKVGKMLYSKHCKSCHGNKGLGDGPKAKQLDTPTGDFSSEAFHGQKDGEMYFKSFVGRDEMPNFEKKITDDEDRWAIITYMRGTFNK
jgi:mono/diheme cytochrome c family protein